jgi:hypothetical protein
MADVMLWICAYQELKNNWQSIVRKRTPVILPALAWLPQDDTPMPCRLRTIYSCTEPLES